jgi:hypothetical protein
VTGHTREYPEFKGVFDKVDWMRLNLTSGATLLLDLKSGSRVGVLRPSNKEVLPGEDAADFGPDTAIWDYPEAGGLFLFHKAPAIGTKLVKSVDELGRQSEPETLSGPISGSAVFRVW